MRKLFAVAILLLVAATGFAQYAIKGTVTDTLNYRPLPYASVVLFRAADTVIVAHTRASADGNFTLRIRQDGRYFIRVSFPAFAEYVDVFNINKPVTDLGQVPMVSKEHLLKEVVLTQQISAIKIKGDTTEYIADSFKVKDNATVEDLLKRLPGLQVDKDGKITAQGEQVQKILVDGEEFFSDDPKVVTQGLQANAVNKVQVYNKKSEQAEFTGIDDGQKTKTINLELKDDKKKGYFGKLDAGGGTDGYYQNQAMINAFKAKQQISAFGIVSNTDKVGLGWADNNKYSSGSGTTEINDDGTMTTSYTSSDEDFAGWDGSYNGQGKPQTWTGGAHYANKWDADKDHITANYRYALQDVDINGTTITQNVLPGNGGFTQNQQKNQFSNGDRNGLDFMFEKKIDTNLSVKFSADAGNKSMKTSSEFNTTSLNNEGGLLSNNTRTITSTSTGDFVKADFILKKKFKKKGRTLSVDLKENYKTNGSDGRLISIIDTPGLFGSRKWLDTVSNVNQQKKSSTFTQAFAGKATYTEPLSKVAFLELNYGATINNSSMVNSSYDSTGKVLDSFYSSNYQYRILTNTGGASMKFVYKSMNFSFGGDVATSSWRQTDQLHNDSILNRNYTNLYPHAAFHYQFAKSTALNITYQGSSQQPSISQITPLHQNTDPLNITIGNANLKQEFINKINVSFNDFKILSQRYLWSNFSFSTISDAISTSVISHNGLNATQYINVNGNYNGWGYAGYGFRLKKLDMDLGMQGNVNMGHVNNIINGVANVADNRVYGGGPYISYEKENKYDFNLRGSAEYNDNKATVSTYSTSYWSGEIEFSGTIQLPKKFEIHSSVDVMLREKTVLFDKNNNVVKWNAYIGKKFLKKSQLEVKISVFDILDQNIGYSRMAQSGIITENTYNTIRRYGMLNLVWNFTHNPIAAGAQPEGQQIIIKN